MLLAFIDNASGSPQTVTLTGTGVQPTPPADYQVCVNGSSSGDVRTVPFSVNVQ